MHKFFITAKKSSTLASRPAGAGTPDPQAGTPGLLNVLVGVSRWLTRTACVAHRYRCGFGFAIRTVRASHRLAPTSLRDKNLCIIRAILPILFLGSLTFGQVFSTDETVSRIADNLMCTCGCPHIIGQCGDECSVAPQLVHEISQLVTEGKTEEEVYKIFEDKYGLSVRAVPKAEGFNLLAWVMPFVGLLAGVVVVFFVVNRLKPGESSPETDSVHPEIDEKYRKLIDRELER